MLLLVFSFLGILLLTFVTVVLVTRPTAEQKAVEQRLAIVKATGGGVVLTNTALDQLLKTTQESSFGWLEKLFDSYRFSRRMELLILQSKSNTTVGNLLFTSFGLVLVGAVVAYLFFPVPAVAGIIGVVLGYLPVATLKFKRDRRIKAFNDALPDAIDMMARALRAGHSMVASLGILAEQSVEPARSEFSEVFRKQNYGLPLRDALMQMLDRVPSQDLRVMVTAILVQKDTGGNLAEILDRTVFVVRERLRIHGEIRTHTAQGRMTGWILCALPVVMLLLINLINPGYSKALTDDELGRKLLYAGVFLLALGAFLIRQIVNGIEV